MSLPKFSWGLQDSLLLHPLRFMVSTHGTSLVIGVEHWEIIVSSFFTARFATYLYNEDPIQIIEGRE
jgi:hypothetical protein